MTSSEDQFQEEKVQLVSKFFFCFGFLFMYVFVFSFVSLLGKELNGCCEQR